MTPCCSPKATVRKWRAAVFDLDDTLYPEKDFVLSGFRAVAAWAGAELSIPENDGYHELVRLHDVGVRGDTFDRWLASYGFPASVASTLVDVYRGHRPTLRPFPEIAEMLASLRGRFLLG